MKQLLLILALLPTMAFAGLPAVGTYKCHSFRAFQNTTESTRDYVNLEFGYSKAKNPMLKLSVLNPVGSAYPALFGGTETLYLAPLKGLACTSRSPGEQGTNCALAQLPALNDNQNLFTDEGEQYVHSVNLSGNFRAYSNMTAQHNNLAMVVNYRKNSSHWERLFECQLVK